MKIGTILKRRYNGSHEYTRLVVLHDYRIGLRFLYDIDNRIKVGDIHALYSEVTDERLSKKEISELSIKLGTSNLKIELTDTD